MNGASYQIFVFIPAVNCDVCNRESFHPPGLWPGRPPAQAPDALRLKLMEKPDYQPPTFTILGCSTQEQTEATALKHGWKRVELPDRGEILMVCPKCQELLAALTEGER